MFPRISLFYLLSVVFVLTAQHAFSQAAEPSANPTTVSFSNVKTYAYGIGFDACDADGYIVLRKENAAMTAQPADGITYHQGDAIGDAQVVYVGSNTSFTLKGAMATKAFYISVFAYNGSSSNINYRQSDAATANVTMPATMKANYYNALNTSDTAFVTQLKNRIRNPYTQKAYADYDETMVKDFAASDFPGGLKSITCVYSGQEYTYAPPFSWTPGTPFSREHTWCHSWMPTYPSTTARPYTDYHHLFPTNQNQANGVRSNHPLGRVSSTLSAYLEGQLGYNSQGQIVYEPRDAHKGDAARTLFYMALRYDGVDGKSWTFNWLNDTLLPSIDETTASVDLLLDWHAIDAPDSYEISRNDYVQSLQQNRNPFIDHPEYTNFIDFNTLRYKYLTNLPSAQRTAPLGVHVYPVPSSGDVTVTTNCAAHAPLVLRWYNTIGAEVKKVKTTNCDVAHVDASDLPDGLYLLLVSQNGAETAVRWLKK